MTLKPQKMLITTLKMETRFAQTSPFLRFGAFPATQVSFRESLQCNLRESFHSEA